MDTRRKFARWTAIAFVALGAIVMLAPFYFMFVFATHSRTEIFQLPPPLVFGGSLADNIHILTTKIPFWRNLGWSVYVAVIGTALTLLFCSMGGYALVMYEFRYKKLVYALVAGLMMLPSFLSMIPTFIVMDALKWIDQPRALYLPSAASAFGVFLMRQFISASIPKEIVEAARMDGCGEFRIFRSIVLPLLGPPLAVLSLVTFIASWNNFVGALVVLRTSQMYTLPLALRSMQNPVNMEWGALMAGAAIATVPLLIVFAFASRRLISGLTASALK